MNRLMAATIGFCRQHRYLLFSVALVILFSCFPSAVERYYSRSFYPFFSFSLRKITVLIPFSLGDLLYGGTIFYLLYLLTRGCYNWVAGKQKPDGWAIIRHSFLIGLWVYLIFKIFWGFNYDRPTVDITRNLGEPVYTLEELTGFNDRLISTLNEQRAAIPGDTLPAISFPEIQQLCLLAYEALARTSPELRWRSPSLKKSLFAALGDWVGYTGYYNPFTGEAQVRTELPAILLPYIACHEVAHQLGYARESEASYIGWLAAEAQNDARLRYSAALDLYDQVQQELWRMYALQQDSAGLRRQIRENTTRLDKAVQRDRKSIRQFFRARTHAVTPAFNELYAQYLRMNGQGEGLRSYREVVGLIVAEERSRGKKTNLN